MDLLGHLAVIEEAGVVAGEQLWKDAAVLALLPNLTHSHFWAFDDLWDAHEGDDPNRRIVQGHMICDWVIHFGEVRTPERKQIGWAYGQAPVGLSRLDAFMDHVVARRLASVDPRTLDDRAHLERDFAHTAVECALDIHVTERHGPRVRFDDVRRALRQLVPTSAGMALVCSHLQALGGYTEEPDALLERTVTEFGEWASIVEQPTDFAALTLCSKYRLEPSRAAIEDVSAFLHDIANGLERSSVSRIFEAVVERIADPRLALR
jgi:hypothetical protein